MSLPKLTLAASMTLADHKVVRRTRQLLDRINQAAADRGSPLTAAEHDEISELIVAFGAAVGQSIQEQPRRH